MTFRGKLLRVIVLTSFVSILFYQSLLWLFSSARGYELTVALGALILSASIARMCYLKLIKRVDSLKKGLENLIDGDFSVSLAEESNDEFNEIVRVFNCATANLRTERQHINQRELILDAVIQYSSLSLILVNQGGRILYANSEARQLFRNGAPLINLLFQEVLTESSGQFTEAFNKAVSSQSDGIFSVAEGSAEQVFHLSSGKFVLNAEVHHLYLIKRLTQEMLLEENRTWKKVVRVISHELNNSLAPINSMAHTGAMLLDKQDYTKLPQVFSAIAERAQHLKEFIGTYSRMSKLPTPIKKEVEWEGFLNNIGNSYSFNLKGCIPERSGFFDARQVEQVLLNLLKNAHESESSLENIDLSIEPQRDQVVLSISDRGCGMTPEVMRNALLPLYTTKQSGSGIGLPLSFEIVHNHGGTLSMSNREGGGVMVTITLPWA